MDIVLATVQLDLRMALQILLREEPGVRVVGTASSSACLRALFQASQPDMVLFDWDLPDLSPVDLVAEAKSLARCQVIVLGRDLDIKPVALMAGADAFVLRGDPNGHLLIAIRQARSRQALEIESNPLPTDSESGLSSSEAE
jgi:DNA-binding NarL/FixJ family response regulator